MEVTRGDHEGEYSTSTEEEIQDLLAEINRDDDQTGTSDLSQLVVATSSTTSRPPQGSLGKRRSLAWMHYKKVNEHKALCCICNVEVATSGNTTNMLKVNVRHQ